MSHPNWPYLLLTALALQLSSADELRAQDEVSFTIREFMAGGLPWSVRAGDLNGDGHPDLASVSPGRSTLSSVLGNGDGTFDPFQEFPMGQGQPVSLALGDFNGDGRQDVATANMFTSSVSSLLGRGDGTFDTLRDFQAGINPISITVGDFDDDGRQDLVAVNENLFPSPNTLSVLLGQGDGTFAPHREFAAGGVARSVIVGDFNGDGRQDLATSNFNGNVSILLGVGDGAFQPAQNFSVAAGATPLNFDSITVGDFNGDGRQDLATANYLPPSVSILIGNGDGTFALTRTYSVGGTARSVTVGDFNDDGRQDLATGNEAGASNVSVLLGKGDGTFQAAQDFVGGSAISITVGDFNGDGGQDLALPGASSVGALTVLINTPVEGTTYRLTRIGDELFSPIVSDINENGDMAATTRGITEPRRAILLRDGMVVELSDLAGGASPEASATAINDFVQITGTNRLQDSAGNSVTRGFLWEGGQIRDLGIDPGAVPLDINNQGQIVGFSVSAENLSRPFVWQDGRTSFLEALVCLGNPGGSARAINHSGAIVGSSTSPAGRRAVIWERGASGGITPLEPPFPLEEGEAVDVNDRGDVIGFYFNESGEQMHTALLWRGEEVTVMPPLDHPEANAAILESINNQGHIVGHTHLGSGRSIATLWRAGVALDLNEQVSDGDPVKGFVTLAFATRITDSGLIVASGTDSRDAEPRNNVYFLLRPTGAPASFAAVPPPSPSPPPPTASSPPANDDNGGGAVDLVALLFLILGLSAVSWHRARSRIVRLSR